MVEHRILTTENVPFTYRVAGAGSRFLAWCADQIVLLMVLIAGAFISSVIELQSEGAGYERAFFFIWLLFASLVYYLLWEWLWHGQTPGKWLLGIRVINLRGTNLTLMEALVRNILRFVDWLPLLIGVPIQVFAWLWGGYGLGFAVMCTNRLGRRFGDLAAGTLVVHVEAKAVPLRLLQGEAVAANRERETAWRQRLGSLTKEQKQTILDVCLRRDQLRVKDRARLFAAIAQYLQERLQLPRGEHQSDEKFVQQAAAVLAASSAAPAP
jgi:uncharacterized RDD family membrane protein YckC